MQIEGIRVYFVVMFRFWPWLFANCTELFAKLAEVLIDAQTSLKKKKKVKKSHPTAKISLKNGIDMNTGGEICKCHINVVSKQV